MKYFYFILLLFITVISLKGQQTDKLWAINFTGTGSNQPYKMITDASGNIYVLGSFNGTVNQGAFSLTELGSGDMFVAKYNKSGQIIWLKQFGGTGIESPSTISLSNDENYFYISGSTTSNPCVFDGNNMATFGVNDIFIAKYKVDGTFQWVHNSGYGALNQIAACITTDNSDNIVLVGAFFTNITFYGGVTTLTAPVPAVKQNFLSKFDSNGNLLWAMMLEGSVSATTVRSVSSDASGYYLSGQWSGNFLLDVDTITSTGLQDGFLFKTDQSGLGQWVRKIAGTGTETLWRQTSDVNGFQFIIGYFNSPTINIDSTNTLTSSLTYSNSGSNDILYACYAPDGTLQYAKVYGSTGDDQGQAISMNSDHVIIGGQYSGSINFGADNLTNSASDAFMVETNRNGTVLSVKRAFGTITEFTKTSDIASDSTNIFCGDFTSPTIDIDGTILTNAAGGLRDMFLVKYGKITIAKAITDANCAVSSDGAIDLTISGNGTAPYSYVWSGPGATTPTEDQTGLPTGMYYVTLTDANLATKTDSAFVDVMPVMSATLDNHSALVICAADANGEATVVTTNGVAPFTYKWDDGFVVSPIRNDLDTGWHYVTITDFCNIPTEDSIRVNYLPELNVNITSSTPASCPVGGDGYAFALSTSGVPPYSYIWSSSASTNSANNLNTGWQYITVTDFCISRVDSINVTWLPVVTATVAMNSAVTCIALNDGSATITASLGKAPYTYAWSTGEVTATATTLVQGWNYYTVTDACTSTKTDSINISLQSALVSSVTLNSQASCPASSDGIATATVTSGILPYIYLWDNGDGTATSNTLTVGWHYVTITDGCGPKKDSVLVTNMPLAQVSLSTTNILLICATDLGSATVQTINGVAPYTYTWDDPITLLTPTRNDLDTGWHYVTVTDVCNIPFTGSIRVNHLPEVTTSIVSSQVASCPGGNNGQATVQASSGVPPYSYQWTSFETTAAATNLSTGWQYVTVTDFCKSHVDSALIGSMPLLSTSITASTPANCIAASNGTATVTATNGGVPYTYIWTSGEPTATAVALAQGWNYVTVSDVCLTTKIDSVNISVQSALVSSVTLTTQASCPTSNNGAALATVSAGILPYSFLWSNGDVTASATLLDTGWVYVTITDGCGPKVDSIHVTNVPLAQISLSTQNILLTCATDLGTVTVQTINGVAPFVYDWGLEGIYALPTRNDLAPGWHYVTVTDVCNIPFVDSVRVNNLPEVITSIVSSGIASCSAGGDGTATVQAISGVPPYTYTWSTGNTNATANDLLTGWQYVSVSDYCITRIDSVFITSQPSLMINITDSTAVSCAGGTNGTATITATYGGVPYNYIWSSGEISATAIQLIEGWNYVTVSDGCGSLIDSVFITLNAPMSIDITSSSPTSCSGGNNGGATVTVTNGSSPVTYLWSTNNLFSDTLNQNAFASNLNNAWNYVQVTDFCTSIIDSVQIGYLPVLTANITFSVPASCLNTADGKASVTASNGAAPYTYLWSDTAATTGFVAIDLFPGWNYVTVTDQCVSVVDSVNISNLPSLSINATSVSLVSCAGGSNGSAVVTTTNGVSPFTYTWNTTETNDTAITLIPGWNYVTVTDICGSLVDSVEITVVPVVTATYDKTAEIYCFGDSTAIIIVEPVNGLLPYSYTWGDTTLTTFDRTGLGAGKYYFTVTDGCNSTYSDSVVVNQPGALSLSMITTNTSFTGLSDGAIDLLMSGGTQPYNFDWSNSVIVEDQVNIPEGTYYITVTDNNGCLISDSTTIVTDSWHIEIYKAFTPNDDGKNDVWNIKYISAYPDCSVTIFNEWGIQVFESTGYETAWDGTNKKGNKLPSATYYYIIDLKDGSKVYTGYVTLVK